MSSVLDCLNDPISSDDEFDNYFNPVEKKTVLKGEVVEDKKEEEEIVLGIDLGTTNSCCAIWRNKNLEVIPDNFGHRTIPSVVAFGKNTKYVGKEAKNQIDVNSGNCFYEVKRLIGRKLEDTDVQNDLEFLSYGVDHDEHGNVILRTDDTNMKDTYTAEEISSMVLMKIKHMAEDYLKRPINKAVVTVPAYFNDSQREATRDAMAIASLECLRIINEPTAAALAYGLEAASKFKGRDINVIVCDIGGGTTDVSVLNICDGMFQVLSSSGNTHLGGSDFDTRLVSHAMKYFKAKNKIQKLNNLSLLSLHRLRKSCEHAKKLLSQTSKTVIAVKDFYDGKNLYMPITRKDFEKVCRDLFILCLKPVEDALTSAELEREEIDEIILVGGVTRIPLIRENITRFFNGKQPNGTINPDEVVAAGAAIQGYIIANNRDPFSENVVLLDVIPLSLGVETIGGLMTTLIPRNSVIPINRKQKFTTDQDYKTSVEVKIFEGERKLTKDNFLVGEFELLGLEEAPRGIPEIEVTFAVDINGIISVTAEDLKNPENKNSITITGNKGRLSKEEVKQLVEEAQEMELRDRIEQRKKQLYYEIDDLCSNVIVNVNREDYKIKEDDVKRVTEDIDDVYNWLKEKGFSDREHKDYERILKRIKEKYGTLILKLSGTGDKVKAVGDSSQTEGTTVYNDDEEEETVYEQIEKDEFGFTDETEEQEKAEIRELRRSLQDLCESIADILSSTELDMKTEHITQLMDYVNDISLWSHVSIKIKKVEYLQKIDEINKICDDIMSNHYKDQEIFRGDSSSVDIKKEELQQLCYALLSTVKSNKYSVNEDKITMLKDRIQETLDWILDGEILLREAELKGENVENPLKIDEIQSKIDDINDLCNSLYQSMVGINLDLLDQDETEDGQTQCDLPDEEILNPSVSGTSIQNLLKNRK